MSFGDRDSLMKVQAVYMFVPLLEEGCFYDTLLEV